MDKAVETLLDHWTIRKPIGPCHFGIGTQFMQVEYPFLRYNLFYYVYVLSFYTYARQDKRFLSALQILSSKRNEEGLLLVERPNRRLGKMSICKKGNLPMQLLNDSWKSFKERAIRTAKSAFCRPFSFAYQSIHHYLRPVKDLLVVLIESVSILCIQDLLAQTNFVRCDFHQLVVFDELQGFLQCKHTRRL